MRRLDHRDAKYATSPIALVSFFPVDFSLEEELRAASGASSRDLCRKSVLRTVFAPPRRSSTRVLIICAALSLHGTCVSANGVATRSKSADVHALALGQWSGLLADASLRTGLPAQWLHDLMRAESNGNASAVSLKGAVGLMQLMPATYAALRVPLGLGADPFRPRDNILAGAVYLRLLVDRYGWPSALAAYNAGPRRLDAFLIQGRALPEETLAYLLKFTSAPADDAVVLASIRSSTLAVLASRQPRSTSTSKPTLFAAAPRPSAAEASVGVLTAPIHQIDPSTWRESSLFVPAAGPAATRE